MNERYFFKFATKKAGCKGPDIYNGDMIWDESDGPVHLKFWSGKEYVRLSDIVRNEVNKYMKETNRMSDRPTPETDEQINGKPCTRFSIAAGDSLRDALVPSEFARKLERERNAYMDGMIRARSECNILAERLRKERDEAREEWGEASMDAAQLLSEKTKAIAERDEAREALDRASLYISNHTGSCPYELFDIEPHDSPCSEVCDKYTNDMHLCWKKHFANKEAAK